MDDPKAIRDLVLRLDGRRLDSVEATEVARDLRALAWRDLVLRPVGRALAALWRGLTAHTEMPSRTHSERIAP